MEDIAWECAMRVHCRGFCCGGVSRWVWCSGAVGVSVSWGAMGMLWDCAVEICHECAVGLPRELPPTRPENAILAHWTCPIPKMVSACPRNPTHTLPPAFTFSGLQVASGHQGWHVLRFCWLKELGKHPSLW